MFEGVNYYYYYYFCIFILKESSKVGRLYYSERYSTSKSFEVKKITWFPLVLPPTPKM